MFVERFLQWIRLAPVARRADAAHALARAYLYSPLSDDERDGLEAALTVLLDDPAQDVRFALADALAVSEKTPHHIALALTAECSQIAALVAERSPVLIDTELVDLVASRDESVQCAVARRPFVSRSLAAAIAEVGSARACLDLVGNPAARVARFSLDRIVERHGDEPDLREVLLQRDDLPLDMRQALLARLSDSLKALVVERNWLVATRADIVVRDACERAVIAMSFAAPASDVPALVRRLIETDAMTPALLIRAVAAGQVLFFQEALTSLSGMASARVAALLAAGRASGLNALLEKAGLPPATFPAFSAAIDVIRDFDEREGRDDDYRRATRLIDGIVKRYEARGNREIDAILALLRRFAMEARRDAARSHVARLLEAA